MSEQQDWMDMREVLHRVRGTWASQELMISELLGSARPPGGRSAKPWRDARVYAAIDACVSSGMLTMQSALCGTVLRLTERGREALDYEPPRSRERDAIDAAVMLDPRDPVNRARQHAEWHAAADKEKQL